jgi:hypothetical protein
MKDHKKEMSAEEIVEAAGVKDGSNRKNFMVQAVIIYDDKGNYLIHGSNDGTPADLLKKMQPLWDINPLTETARYVTFQMSVPEVASLPSVRIFTEQ